MIFIYGDSHARFSFKRFEKEHINKSESSITMHRIGRDNIIVNCDPKEHNANSTIILVYGEIDCRCHIQRQINTGRDEDDIIQELVGKYFTTIKNNLLVYKKIIIIAIIPPTEQNDCESIHGTITHDFPFVGTDEDRRRFTVKMNKLIEQKCKEYAYTYINPYTTYTRDNGCLKFEYSDRNVHILQNDEFLEEVYSLL